MAPVIITLRNVFTLTTSELIQYYIFSALHLTIHFRQNYAAPLLHI